MTDGDGTRASGASSYAQVNGLNVYYEIHGEGAPLILLHGGVGASVVLDWNCWSRKLLQLADPGLELLDELTECAILGLKVDVARYAG